MTVRELNTPSKIHNESVVLTLEDALERAKEHGADGLALVMVMSNGEIVSGFVDGRRYFQTMGGLTDLQIHMNRTVQEEI